MSVPEFIVWPPSPGAAGVAVACAIVAGAMVGSFLNVVAHRVPRGETVVHGRSHCPACGATIRPRDNVPVLGWLLLRGRCRDCGAAISARYPLVEGGCGMLAGVIAAAEVAEGGSAAAALMAWGGHAAAALVIVAWSLLAERGHVVSRTTVATAAALGALAAATVPALAPLSACCGAPPWATPPAWTGCLLASLAGLGAGWVAAMAVGRPARAACCIVGAMLGWQAACFAAVAAWTARTVWRQVAAGCLATVAAIIGWHPLTWVWNLVCRTTGG